MIKNIIFDIGNVLADFRWADFLRDKGFDDAMIDRIAAASVRNPLWCELDRGVWTEEQLMQAFIKEAPELEKELHIAFDDVRGMVTPRGYAIPWLEELKAKGYRIWYLSNFSAKVERECSESLSFMPLMDGGILSYRDRLIKPDPAIYLLLLERYGLVAEESVFLDDTFENIEAAEKLGIHGIHFKEKEQAKEELRKLGVM